MFGKRSEAACFARVKARNEAEMLSKRYEKTSSSLQDLEGTFSS